MDGRVAIVTGANRGIGRETAKALAIAGCTVVLACRSAERAAAAREELRGASGNDSIAALVLDLASIRSIKAFASEFSARFPAVDILVNNAGISSPSHERSEDGYERTFATNVLGPYVLTRLLLPHFREGGDSRIINMSSDFYKFGRFSLGRLDSYSWVKAYAVSKYALLLLTLELAERLKARGITVNAAHPGVVRTHIMLTDRWYDCIINAILAPLYIEEAEGAKTGIHLALSEDMRGRTGGYYVKCRERAIPERYNDRDLRGRLAEYCERIFAEKSQASACPSFDGSALMNP